MSVLPAHEEPHVRKVEEVLDALNCDRKRGLTQSQVENQRKKFGLNCLDEEEKKPLWKMVLEQFEDNLVLILLASAFVSFVLAWFDDKAEEGFRAFVEPFVIVLILVANAIVGVWQESNAEKALDALKALQSAHANVLREGTWQSVEAQELVPGDLVEVRVGDKVPADLRVVEVRTTTLRLEQSQLTGESMSVSKESTPISDKDAILQAKTNMLFSSTTVSTGICLGVTVGTGMRTEIGKIQAGVKAAAEDEEQTPLQQKLAEFGDLLAKVIFVICVVVWLINYKHFTDPVHGSFLRGCIYYLKIAVALAVAAIPEGLPAVITTCLALGTKKMAQRNAIVRKLPSVETLGCTTVICSDKTGTLTTNEMCCVKVALPVASGGMKTYSVEGHNYKPVGQVQGLQADWASNANLTAFAKCASTCNESRLAIENDKWTRTGEPTEAALRVLVEKLGCPDQNVNRENLQVTRNPDKAMAFSDYWAKQGKKLAVLEFNRERKSMSVLFKETKAQSNTLYVKGAPEGLLDRCTHVLMPNGSQAELTPKLKKDIQTSLEAMAGQALRTLALAKRDLQGHPLGDYTGPGHEAESEIDNPDKFVKIESKMLFLGLVGIIDPPRPECKTAIEECRVAGISVIMITGDNKATAEAIATNLGILHSAGAGAKGRSFTGKEFGDLSDAEKVKVVKRIVSSHCGEGAVFSRTEPTHKQIIVKILKSLGDVTAMTGDGVNDAPALKQADIGIAMGITGTEVAKEASDMVLADDNFSTIVSAVEEGRSIYNNMKAFIRYLISSNIGEVASISFTAALGIPEGLAPLQLLWINLVTDGLPATALGFNPPDLNVMQKPPRRKTDPLINGWVFFRYMVIGIYVGFATVGVFIYWYVFDEGAVDQHTLVSLGQLVDWGHCSSWPNFQVNNLDYVSHDLAKDPCAYFTSGKTKACTLSLTVLVVIEMLNAFNALSEDGSLLHMPPWANPYLILACAGSIIVHCAVLYVPFLVQIFNVVPLTYHDWVLVMAFASPVIIIDEVLKFFSRLQNARELAERTSGAKKEE